MLTYLSVTPQTLTPCRSQLLSIQQTKMASSSSAAFHATLLPRVPTLLRSLLSAIAGGAPRSHLNSLSELLHACVLRLAEQARPALKELLTQDGWPSERASKEVKDKFERAVLSRVFPSPTPFATIKADALHTCSARTGKQVRQAVTDFALVCRGLDGSAYGAATTY